MQVDGLGQYTLLGETVDDAAGEAFDKMAKLLGLGYPGGPALSKLADQFAQSGWPQRFKLPRPMLHSGDLEFQFQRAENSRADADQKTGNDTTNQAALAFAFQEAVIDVLTEKAMAALSKTGLTQLVVAGGVGANRQLRTMLCFKKPTKMGATVFFPELEFCTDNGAMIAFAGSDAVAARFGETND